MILKAVSTFLLAVCFLPGGTALLAQEMKIDAPEGWRSEGVELPPPFAPELKLKGQAQLQFSPGMFDKDSDLFFTYVFAFRTEAEPKLEQEIIESSLLAYYQGLAKRVSRNRELDVDTFELKLEKSEEQPDDATSYTGTLDWTEPFATNASQTLKLDVESRFDEESKQNYLFVCASPSEDEEVWKQLLEIRSGFNKSLKAGK